MQHIWSKCWNRMSRDVSWLNHRLLLSSNRSLVALDGMCPYEIWRFDWLLSEMGLTSSGDRWANQSGMLKWHFSTVEYNISPNFESVQLIDVRHCCFCFFREWYNEFIKFWNCFKFQCVQKVLWLMWTILIFDFFKEQTNLWIFWKFA